MPDLPPAPDPVAAPLHPRERDGLLAALRATLRRAPVGNRMVAGLAATPSPDAPLRALDNAVAAAALAAADLRAADPVLATAPLGFLAALAEASPEAGLPRSVAPAVSRVTIARADPDALRVVTPWHVLTGDLTRGLLVQHLRGRKRIRPAASTTPATSCASGPGASAACRSGSASGAPSWTSRKPLPRPGSSPRTAGPSSSTKDRSAWPAPSRERSGTNTASPPPTRCSASR
ncbi:hypothetical protein ACE7GA_09340 [Roseomonas sp. CCTCC AB2023176]|uniref:hypothetical protein n=1 Tax=Roseomonas sp. CCTCC AB2023176 TaxID=3342640 RepID=UPI0035DEDA10